MKIFKSIKRSISIWCGAVAALYLENKLHKQQALIIAKAKQRVWLHPQVDIIDKVIDRQVEYLVSNGHNVKSVQEFEMYLNTAVGLILAMYKLSPVVSIQPMTAPVGLCYLMEMDKKDGKENEFSLRINSHAISAITRQFHAGYTMELAQDLKALHGLDVAAELTSAITAEVIQEMYHAVWSDIVKAATHRTEIVYEPGYEKTMGVKISMVANQIAQKTRRGAGNVVIMDAETFETSMRMNPQFVLDEDTGGTEMRRMGVLNDTIVVYTTDTLIYTQLTLNGRFVIVGYKGLVGEVDAGYVLSPYVPIVPTGMILNPTTFQPMVKLGTRYGSSSNGSGTEVFTNGDYYAIISLKENIMEDDKNALGDRTQVSG